VILNPQHYDAAMADAKFVRNLKLIEQSINEFERGEGVSADEVFAGVRSLLGIADDS